jgi:hypothetical protein
VKREKGKANNVQEKDDLSDGMSICFVPTSHKFSKSRFGRDVRLCASLSSISIVAFTTRLKGCFNTNAFTFAVKRLPATRCTDHFATLPDSFIGKASTAEMKNTFANQLPSGSLAQD